MNPDFNIMWTAPRDNHALRLKLSKGTIGRRTLCHAVIVGAPHGCLCFCGDEWAGTRIQAAI